MPQLMFGGAVLGAWVDWNWKDNCGKTPFYLALFMGRLDCGDHGASTEEKMRAADLRCSLCQPNQARHPGWDEDYCHEDTDHQTETAGDERIGPH